MGSRELALLHVCIHLAFGGIAAPSVGNALKLASLSFMFSADAVTQTLTC